MEDLLIPQNYKNENTEVKHINSIQKIRILKTKNSFLELERHF